VSFPEVYTAYLLFLTIPVTNRALFLKIENYFRLLAKHVDPPTLAWNDNYSIEQTLASKLKFHEICNHFAAVTRNI
jgi:hypothetical protein